MLLYTEITARRALCLAVCIACIGFASSVPLISSLEKVEDTTGLTVTIEAGSDVAHSTVKVSGILLHVISDEERQTFHLSDYQLKQDAGKYFGKVPDDAYLHSPTPWNDLYKTYGWNEVHTNLEATSSEILGISTESLTVKQQEFENNSTFTADFDVSISQQVSNSVTNSWQTGGALTIGQKFTYEVGFLGTGAGGETSFSYSQSWGVGGSNTKSVTMGSSSGVMVTLKPRQGVRAVLTASRSVMKVRVTYSAYLTGSAAVNYGHTYKGHHFWDLPIESIMESANNPNFVKSTEDIKIGYYSDGKITLHDIKTNEVLATHLL